MRTLLVTGGAGFIGVNFVHHVLAAGGIRVVNLDALTYAGNLESLGGVIGNANHEFIEGDVRDRETVRALLERHRPDAIVHFAAESHVDRSIEAPDTFVQTNVVGTFHLLDEALRYWDGLPKERRARFRFLHISTDEVFGSLGPTGRFSETTPYAPNSPYSASKAASDHFARAYHHTYGLPVLVTNCSNNYGPYQFPEKLVPLVTLNAAAGARLPVYGDGGNVRDWLYVVDHCEALLAVLARGRPGETYNIGGDAERTNLEVVQGICAILDELKPRADARPHAEQIEFVADRPGHDRRYAMDTNKIRRELDWSPAVDFNTGLRETVQWYLEHTDWCRRIQDNRYRGERLGLRRQDAG